MKFFGLALALLAVAAGPAASVLPTWTWAVSAGVFWVVIDPVTRLPSPMKSQLNAA